MAKNLQQAIEQIAAEMALESERGVVAAYILELAGADVGRDTRARQWHGGDGIEPSKGSRYFECGTTYQLIGIAAVAMNAKAARLHAEIFMAAAADPTDAAADPGID